MLGRFPSRPGFGQGGPQPMPQARPPQSPTSDMPDGGGDYQARLANALRGGGQQSPYAGPVGQLQNAAMGDYWKQNRPQQPPGMPMDISPPQAGAPMPITPPLAGGPPMNAGPPTSPMAGGPPPMPPGAGFPMMPPQGGPPPMPGGAPVPDMGMAPQMSGGMPPQMGGPPGGAPMPGGLPQMAGQPPLDPNNPLLQGQNGQPWQWPMMGGR